MTLIALTGGIASGKSTIAAHLRTHGATVIDADVVAREVVEPGEPALASIVETFGDGVLSVDGQLNRAHLADLVFHDAQKLTRLNSIVHPAVQRRVEERVREICTSDPDAVVVYDVPLLYERTTGHLTWDFVVVAEAPDEVRVRRMVETRGMSREDAEARIANQVSNATRRAIADVVIDTSGTLEDTLQQSDALWQRVAAHPGR